MPDDYLNQSTDTGMTNLLKDLGVSDDNAGDVEGTQAQPEQQPSTEAGQADGDTEGAQQTEQQPEQQPDAKANLQQQKANQAFAEMRSRNAAYEKTFNLLKQTMGFTGTDEQFHEHLKNISYAQQAKTQGQGTDPNLLKRLDDLESKNKILEEQNNRTLFASNLKNLQEHFKLSDNDLEAFVNLAIKEGIDLTAPGTNFITLYQGLNHDALTKKAIEDERQKWLSKQAQGQSTGVAPDGKSGKSDPSPTDVNTMAEFNSLLSNLK